MNRCVLRHRLTKQRVSVPVLPASNELAISVGFRQSMLVIDGVTCEEQLVEALLAIAALCCDDPDQKVRILDARRAR